MALTPQQQAQLQAQLNSTNPAQKAQAQKMFAALLKQDPAAMTQFRQQVPTVPKPTQPAPNPAAGQSALPAAAPAGVSSPAPPQANQNLPGGAGTQGTNTAPAGGGANKQRGANTAPPTGGGQKQGSAPTASNPNAAQDAYRATAQAQQQQQNAAQNGYRATAQAQNQPMGSAQLAYALNSTDPQTKAAAQAQFKQNLLNDPAAMQQFRNAVNAGKPPAQPNTAPAGGGGQKPPGGGTPPPQSAPLVLNAGQQAQLQRDLNSPNPQTKAAAQKIFAEQLKRDPNAMQQFKEQAAAGGPPLVLNAQQQAQLQRDLNSADPQTKAAAQKIFAELLKRDPNAMTKFRAEAAAGGQSGAPKSPGAPTGPTFEDILGAQFGKDNPFGLRAYDTAVPIQAAEQAAQRMLSENLAGVNARFGGMGTANSDRAALANAQAISDTSTFLGEKIANIKENAFQNDANRAFNAVMGAAQNDNQRSQIAMAMNQMLGQYGTGLTGVGAQETQLPNLSEIIGLLAAFSGALGGGTSKGSGAQGMGWKR